MSADQIRTKLDKMDLRPANLQEGLSFGERYPDVQREFPIVFLGSAWRRSNGYYGNSYYGYARLDGCGGYDSMRVLCLDWAGDGWGDWGGNCRFAAVSKQF